MLAKMFELGEQEYSEDDAQWDKFVENHPHGSLLQTTNWARVKSRFGWSTRRVWLKSEGKLVAGAQILFRSWGMGIVKMGYIPHGPLVNWDNSEQVAVLFNQIDQAAYQHRAGILKLEPLLWQDEFDNDKWEAICRQTNCLPHTDNIQPPRTIMLDIRGTEDEIMARMKQKTRYNIRLSARKEVIIKRGGKAEMPAFIHLMQTTGQRNQFGVHSPDYFAAAYELFSSQNQCALFLAEYEGEPLAGIMVFKNGRQANYLYGASSGKERKRMPSYALQWAAIRWAKEIGCTHYDLWGIPDEEHETLETQFKDRNDGLWGVYRHKRGYGGQLKRTVGAADRVYNKRLYRLYQWRRNR